MSGLAQVAAKADNNKERLDSLLQTVELSLRATPDGSEYIPVQLSNGDEHKILLSSIDTQNFIEITADRTLTVNERTRIIFVNGNNLTVTIPDNLGWVNGRRLTVIVGGTGFTAAKGSNVTFNSSQASFQDVANSVYEYVKLDNNLYSVVQVGVAAEGGLPRASATGTTLTFTGYTSRNEATPSSGNITLDYTNAVHLASETFVNDGTVYPTITGTLEGRSGEFKLGYKNLFHFTYYSGFGSAFLNIQADTTPTLGTPQLTLTQLTSTSIRATWAAITNATGYDLLIGTTNVVGSATAAVGYDGTSLTFDFTGLTTGTEYFVFARATAVNYNSSAYDTESITPSLPTLLFSDDFTGTTIDTSKWTVSEPTPSAITLTQNNELIFTSLSTSSISGTPTTIDTDGKYSFDTTSSMRYVTFTVTAGNTDENLGFIIQGGTPNTNIVRFIRNSNNSNQVYINNTNNGVLNGIHNSTENLTGTWKMDLGNSLFVLHKWNGSSWSQIRSEAFGESSDFYIKIQRATETISWESVTLDNCYVTDFDFTTQLPV